MASTLKERTKELLRLSNYLFMVTDALGEEIKALLAMANLSSKEEEWTLLLEISTHLIQQYALLNSCIRMILQRVDANIIRIKGDQ